MDEFFAGLVMAFGAVFLIVVLAFGSVTMFADVRLYRTIYKQCETQGFIQNETTRITCSIAVGYPK